jgi:DNA/RNA endonuclease YhcR with UshA esterase domain
MPTPTPAPPKAPSVISWDKAKDHIGERTSVYGAVVDVKWASGSKGQPTFLNIGNPYPDPSRFTAVIWIQNRSKFPEAPEVYYLGKTIHVTGLITEYKGGAQIEVKDPSQIQER